MRRGARRAGSCEWRLVLEVVAVGAAVFGIGGFFNVGSATATVGLVVGWWLLLWVAVVVNRVVKVVRWRHTFVV